MKTTIQFGLIMMMVGIVAAAMLVGVRLFTEPRIQAQRETEEQQALQEVLPEAAGGGFEAVKEDGQILYYRGYTTPDRKEIAGYTFLAYGKGYSSVIQTMVGMSPEGKITGIKILSQKETPGLGAKVEEVKTNKTVVSVIKNLFRKGNAVEESFVEPRPWFQEQFEGKRINDLQVTQSANLDSNNHIQSITGATISSKAVTDSIRLKAEEVMEVVKKQEGYSLR